MFIFKFSQIDLLFLEMNTTIEVSGCCPLVRGPRSNVKKNTQVCKCTHTCRSNFIVDGIRPILHQCDITSTAPECPMLLCFKQQLRLFLVIIFVLLFFIQIVYNLDTETVLHQRNFSM